MADINLQPFNGDQQDVDQQEVDNGEAQSKWWRRPSCVAAGISLIILAIISTIVGLSIAYLGEMRDPLPVECGIRNKTAGVWDSGRIKNGQVAAPHSWPWMVYTMRSDGTSLGGALINEYFVATHQDVRPGDFVLLGAHNRSSTTEDTQKILIERVFYHPNATGYNYEMLLVKLENPAKFNKNVKPVCLPEADDVPPVGKVCIFTGWGGGNSGPPYYTDLLHETSATIITDDQCRRDFPLPDPTITNTVFCTADSESYPSWNDWGGPLMCENDDASWTLYGIIFSVSGSSSYHPRYCNVPTMVSWMDEIFKRFDG